MKLVVKPLKQKDARGGLAAIDRASMDRLDLENGDYITIEHDGNRAVARVWPGYPEDEGRGVVRIDGRLRQKVAAGIDDTVAVEKTDIVPAEHITIALPQALRIRGDIGPHIRSKLSGQAVTTGQTVPFSLGFGLLSSTSGRKIPLRIAETEPEGTVVVTDSTEIEVSEQPVEQLEDVVVIATTNRPDLIDSALLRPGRLDRHVHVPVPDEDGRRKIFAVHTEQKPLADDVDLSTLATRTDGYVGADIEAVCREASMAATREFLRDADPEKIDESVGNVRITMDHFEQALREVGPSVTEGVRERYEDVEQRFERGDDEDGEKPTGAFH